MKKHILLLWAMLLALYTAAQIPQGISYQTVVRDNNGSLIASQNVTFRFSVISGSSSGSIMYREVHNANSNELGLVNLVIGQGIPVTGSFSSIVWANDAHYLSVEIDPQGGNAFQEMGTSQLMSVPYALSSGNSTTSMSQLTDVNTNGVTNGQVLKWNGTTWLPANDTGGGNGDNWGTQTIQSNNAFAGNGTTASPLALAQQGATNGQVLKWNGTTWLPANDTGGGNGDNWGTQTTQTGSALTGNGTTASPLNIAQQGASNGQVLKWNGTAWLPAADANTNTDAQTLTISGSTVSITGGNSITLPAATGDNWGSQTLQSNNAFAGNGTTASPLALAQQGATNGQVLKWNGTSWLPAADVGGGAGDNWGSQTIQSNNAFAGNGTTASPLALAQQGATNGQVLKWNGTSWLPAADANTNTDAQTLNISGNTVSITGGNSITLPASTGWGLTGNVGTDDSNFIGTTDNVPLNFRVNNQKAGVIESNSGSANIAYGYQSLNANTTGIHNTATGYQSLRQNTNGYSNTANGSHALYSNTTGNHNTAIGFQALYTNTTGSNNIAIGREAMRNNSTGDNNTANGREAMRSNTVGSANTAHGNRALYFNTTGSDNTAIGFEALYSNTTGNSNTSNGRESLRSNTTGSNNNAYGYLALRSNTTGGGNTASGDRALNANTTGSLNTANGSNTLQNNTTGSWNAANGAGALYSNTTGANNAATGFEALRNNTTASANTAMGSQAMYTNTTGNYNTAHGSGALYLNTIGEANSAVGYWALHSNVTGNANTAIGYGSLFSNNSGIENTANGYGALSYNTSGNNNTGNGYLSLGYNTTGSGNTALGRFAGHGAEGINFNNCTFMGYNSYPTVTRTNVTMLGANIANGQNTANNQLLLGSTAVAQLRAQVTGITAYSDARFKTNVRHDVKGLEFINRLQPVTYNERPEELHKIWGTPDSLLREIDHSDINNTRFIGFLAQDVAKAAKESGFDFPGIDEPRNEKEVYSLRYTDFVMPLVMGMKEQQQMIEQQQQEINELKKLVHALLEKEK